MKFEVKLSVKIEKKKSPAKSPKEKSQNFTKKTINIINNN